MSASPSQIDTALAETLPLVAEERSWSFIDMLSVKGGLAIATWAFLFGGATGQLVGFIDGLIALAFGTALGIGLLFFALVIPVHRYGCESFVVIRSAFGPLGTSLLAVLFVLGVVPFWTAILASMAGASAEQLLGEFNIALSSRWIPTETIIALAVLAFGGWAASRGSRTLRLLNLGVLPLLVILSVGLFASVVMQVGWSTILEAQPNAPPYDRATNLMLAVELNIVAGLSWFGLAGNLGRFGATPRSAVWGSWSGLVLISLLPCLAGLASSLALGSADPVEWMTPLLGPVVGLAMLLVLILANLSSIVGMLQGNLATIVQNFGPAARRLGYAGTVLALTLAAATIMLFATEALYIGFYSIVAFFGAMFAGTIGVLLADRLVLRKESLKLGALHDTRKGSAYFFWYGLNPAALTATFAGFAVYVRILEPVSQVPGTLFAATTATLPAALTGFATHTVLTKLLVIPFGRGAYRAGPKRVKDSQAAEVVR